MFVISWPASFTPASQHLAGAVHPSGFHCVPGCHVGCLACLLPHGCSTCPGSHFLHFIALCSSSRLTIEKVFRTTNAHYVRQPLPVQPQPILCEPAGSVRLYSRSIPTLDPSCPHCQSGSFLTLYLSGFLRTRRRLAPQSQR